MPLWGTHIATGISSQSVNSPHLIWNFAVTHKMLHDLFCCLLWVQTDFSEEFSLHSILQLLKMALFHVPLFMRFQLHLLLMNTVGLPFAIHGLPDWLHSIISIALKHFHECSRGNFHHTLVDLTITLRMESHLQLPLHLLLLARLYSVELLPLGLPVFFLQSSWRLLYLFSVRVFQFLVLFIELFPFEIPNRYCHHIMI